jgi:Rha family phage regulatory protein
MSNTVLKIDPRQLVTTNNNQVITTSFNIAEAFSKRHSDVLKKIDALDTPKDFHERNFALCFENNDLQNGKPQKYYRITKDGFALLAMGFTGAKAMQFKIAYINAFNAMADQLAMKEREQLALLETKLAELQKPETLTPEQQRHIQEAVNAIASERNIHYQTTYHNIKTHFKVGTYKDILKSDYPALCRFLGVMPLYDDVQHDIPVSPSLAPEQKQAIETNLCKVMSLFHPMSDPFINLMSVARALKGKHPNTGQQQAEYLAVI